MKISEKDWERYINKLSAVNQKAAEEMEKYIQVHGLANMDEVINYAFALVTKYGEAATAAACDMYDAVAEAQSASVPLASPAPTASYGEVAKAINGANRVSPRLISSAVSRLVKQAGADTTLANAERDGAQFAWVPHGDTCAFCIALASRGWQYMSKKALKNGHAEHIHKNCDCEYAIRFDDGESTVAGYDPEEYRRMYEEASEGSPQDKINALRRQQYKINKNKINAQKRVAYKSRMERALESKTNISIDMTAEYLRTAKPGTGSISYEANYSKGGHADEIMGAQWLHDKLGGDIILLKEADAYQEKRADYLWRGKLWDYKSPTTEKAADDRLRHGMKQIMPNPGGIILDYKRNPFDLETLKTILSNRAKRTGLDEFDIMIVSEGELVVVLRYKK